jgi:hypothetical protein
LWAASAAGTDQPPANATKIKTASHTKFLTRPIILTQSRAADTLHVFEFATKPYACYRGRFMPGHGSFSYGYYPPNILDDSGKSAAPNRLLWRAQMVMPGVPTGTAESHGLISMPLIIPPVKSKAYDRFGSLFDTVWSGAAELLSTADEIVLIGYSFPRTDQRSLDLFKNAFSQRKHSPRIVIVDPSPERALSVFRDVLQVPESLIQVHAELVRRASQVAAYFSA